MDADEIVRYHHSAAGMERYSGGAWVRYEDVKAYFDSRSGNSVLLGGLLNELIGAVRQEAANKWLQYPTKRETNAIAAIEHYVATLVRSVEEAAVVQRELDAFKHATLVMHKVCDEYGIPKPPENEPGIPWRLFYVLRSLEKMIVRAARAYKAGFIDGAGGTPSGHPSDFGDSGYDALVQHATFHAERYKIAHD